MPLVARKAIPAAKVPEQVVTCEALGGDVLIRGFDLHQSAEFHKARREVFKSRDGETEAQAESRAAVSLLPMVLSRCVLADDEKPVYTEAEWVKWIPSHMPSAMAMFTVATELTGLAPEVEKKSSLKRQKTAASTASRHT